MAKKVKLIEVETLPNGYSLKFDGMIKKDGYMYFTPEQLLEGFMAHIGLEMTDQLNMETIQDFLATAINWRDNKACVKEIEHLNGVIRQLSIKRSAIARTLIQEREKYIILMDDVSSAISELKDYPDKNIKARLEKILKGKKKQQHLSMQGLGVKNDVFNEDDQQKINT